MKCSFKPVLSKSKYFLQNERDNIVYLVVRNALTLVSVENNVSIKNDVAG